MSKNHFGWQYYLTRSHTLFTASLWQEWYASVYTKKLVGTVLKDAIFVENPIGSVAVFRRVK